MSEESYFLTEEKRRPNEVGKTRFRGGEIETDLPTYAFLQ